MHIRTLFYFFNYFFSIFATLEKRGKLVRVNFRKDSWDCSEGQGQKLTNSWQARPRSQKQLRNEFQLQFPSRTKVANTLVFVADVTVLQPASKLSGALWRRGGKRKESLQLRLWKLNSTSPCGCPSTELSDFRQSARSGNKRACKQALKNTCQG